jgi:hypothetical protein
VVSPVRVRVSPSAIPHSSKIFFFSDGWGRAFIGHSIGHRTASGLHTAPDGSLTIVTQNDEPSDPARRANWLPTPAGIFRPLLRVYEPDDAIFDGTYQLSPITRVT